MGQIRTAIIEAMLAAIPVAIVYFAGWAYLTSYLGKFGIDATELDINFTTILVYGFIPLSTVPSVVSLVVLVILASALVRSLSGEVKVGWVGRILKWAELGILLLFLVAALFLIKGQAQVEAKRMASLVWEGQKSQTVPNLSISNNSEKLLKYFDRCRDGRRFRQVIGLPDRMIVICRSDLTPTQRGTIFVVDKGGVVFYTADKLRGDLT